MINIQMLHTWCNRLYCNGGITSPHPGETIHIIGLLSQNNSFRATDHLCKLVLIVVLIDASFMSLGV